MREIYLIEIDGKVSSEGFDNLEDAQKYMKYKAQMMNDYKSIKPIIGTTGATYFRNNRRPETGDSFKEGRIRILFITIKERSENEHEK